MTAATTRPVRTRFAPSPNGPLHLGHALSALANAEAARAASGESLLRIDDIDPARSRAEHAAGIVGDLEWLGLDYAAPLRQSDRMDAYAAALDALRDLGVVYPCYATRGEIRAAVADRPDWPCDPDGAPLYPGLHKALTATERSTLAGEGREPALRLDMEAALRLVGSDLAWEERGGGPGGETGRLAVRAAAWGDVIVARRDVAASYHLAVVVDDAAQDITHVVRGRDLFHATSVHRVLQALLGFDPPTYLHHRLLLGPDGQKLSKSQGAPRLGALRERGVRPSAVRRALLASPLVGPDGPAPTIPS